MPRENVHEFHDESESEDDEKKRTLFCANIDERVTDDILYEVFLQAGPLESARIPKDYNGRPRTYGFITYTHKSTLPYALQLFQGLSLYRKTLTIKYQGNTQPPQAGNDISPGCSNKRPTYDSSSLRNNNNSSFNVSTPQNPFRSSAPDWVTNSLKGQEHISKDMHKNRQHTKYSPYQRKCGEDQTRDHNRRRHYNNGSDRHSDQRSSSKVRR